MTVAEFIVEYLKLNGVERVFGYTGAYILPVFSALEKSPISVTVPVHEQGAVFMADGYAKSSGRLGVVVSTSGPGATNLVTGIASAYMDSVPLLIITGNVPLLKLGGDNFQEIDICNIVTPITKYSTICKRASDIQSLLKECVEVATTGRKGPVLLDVPFDIMTSECEFSPEKLVLSSSSAADDKDVEAVAKLINSSKKPLAIFGGGIKDARKEAEAFFKETNMPYFVTMNSISLIKGGNRVGVISAKKNSEIFQLISDSDLIFAVGTRFNDKSAPAIIKKKNIIHIDADEAELNKNFDELYTACCEAAPFLKKLLPLISKRREAISLPRKKAPTASYLNVGLVADIINKHFSGEVVFDVGSHLVKGVGYLENAENILLSGGLGSMGYAIPAGLGAYLSSGKKTVVLTGDGGFNMSSKELISAVREKANLTVFLMNDNKLTMVRDIQKSQKKDAFCTEKLFSEVSYKYLAKAYNAKYVKIRGVKNLEEKIKDALLYDGVCLVDCILKK